MDIHSSEWWIKVIDNRLNDPQYNKPKYKLVNRQLAALRQQLVEKMAGLPTGQYTLSSLNEYELCKVIDFVTSFL